MRTRTYVRKPGVESVLWPRHDIATAALLRWMDLRCSIMRHRIQFIIIIQFHWHSFDSATMSEAYSEALGWCAAALCLKNMLNHLLVVRCRVSKSPCAILTLS